MQLTKHQDQPEQPAPIRSVIVYALGGAVCSAVVAASSYGIGHLIGLRLADAPGRGSAALIDAIVAVSERTGWGWIGAAMGTVVGLGVCALGRKRVVLGLLGAILGALVFIDNLRTTDFMDGLINWAIIAGIGGLIACAVARVAQGLRKRRHDAVDGV